MLYIEVTQLFEYARSGKTLSGIQRLTYNTAIGLVELMGQENVELLAYSPRFGVYRTAPAKLLDIFAASSKTRLLKNARSSVVARVSAIRQLNPNTRTWDMATIGKFDQILLTESWWWRKDLVDANEALSYLGGPKVYRFIHDIIPISAPRFVSNSFSKLFRDTFIREVANCDVVIANSETTKNEIVRFWELNGHAAKEIAVVPLAHEFKIQPVVRPSILRMLAGLPSQLRVKRLLRSSETGSKIEPFILVVGTLERRKNMLRLLKVWCALSQKYGTSLPKLVFVGQWGVTGGQIWRFLRKIKYLGGRIKILHFINDAKLQKLYEACDFTIYLSSYEGWGLPVGESMWLGKPVLASSSSSLPEVGGVHVEYAHPDDNAEISVVIEKLVFDKTYLTQRTKDLVKARLRSWDDFATDLRKIISHAERNRLPMQIVKAGE